MTSTEDQIRNALGDLAPTAPADGSAYAGVGRSITRRRRQRAATRLAAVAAVALVAVAGASLVGGREEPSGFSTQPGDDESTQPDDGTPPAPGGADDRGAPIVPTLTVIGGAEFELPPGWEAESQPQYWLDPGAPGGTETERHPYTAMCLRRTADPGPLDCTLEMFYGDIPGHEGFVPYDPDGDWSWYQSTDAMACPDGTDPGGEPLDPVRAADGDTVPVQREPRPVGSRTADYSRWDTVCERSGFEFSPQAWFLPESQILIVDVLGQPETEAILASFIFGDEAG
jgi:hypothetical protein